MFFIFRRVVSDFCSQSNKKKQVIMTSLELEKNFTVKEASFIFDCKFHPDQENVALAFDIDGNVLILDLSASKGSETILNLENHHKGSSVRKIDFLNGETLITCARSVKIYDLNTGKFTRKFTNEGRTKIYSLKPIERNIFFTGEVVGTLKMFDLRAGDEPIMDEKQNEYYLSDMDIDSSNRVLLTTSGDGHLTAFNIKSKKLILQSEPFDSGFQSVRYLGHRNKVIVGAEDGALNIFNVGEWGNISDRFPIDTSKRSSGDCSIDGLQMINERKVITSSSDGKLRIVQIFPNRVLFTTDHHKNPIECVHYNPQTDQVISAQSDEIFVHKLVDNRSKQESDEDMEDEATCSDSNKGSKSSKKSKKSSNSFFADL